MNSVTIVPCEELKDFVSHFWAGTMSADEQTNFIYHFTANPNTELAFAFKSSPDRHPTLVFSSILGHTASFGQVSENSFVNIVGVSLFSHAVPLFLNVSPSDLINQFTDLETLLGNSGRMINEKMETALTVNDYIKILSDYFKSQLSKKYLEDKLMTNAMKQIRKYHGTVSINQLASTCCLSEKQFERRFTAYSGFKPKLYSRIIRFESALWQSKHYENLTAVAHTFGYYDQSHFIRDFKKFTGSAPGSFIR
uniref:AraC family transcriptional regulator n=1 Tax=Roseihalotalea indica TaxID=2867963 RepID=A0AA49GTB8_9BACT|nr:AraC family transcriptional regulator [Tunicatimonas sp. TK19036]